MIIFQQDKNWWWATWCLTDRTRLQLFIQNRQKNHLLLRRSKKEVTEPAAEKKEEVKKSEPAPKPVNNTTTSATSFSAGSGPGYFKPQFDQQVRNHPAKNDATASAGIFKTSSGWQDAKYYALIDQVEPGTIIKIINPTNNKMIYAKVLGQMSGIRQNQGYDVRISNAAATALDVADTEKFIVRVNY